jgi:hypothetical protein
MSFSSKEYYEENNCPVWHVDDDGLYLLLLLFPNHHVIFTT